MNENDSLIKYRYMLSEEKSLPLYYQVELLIEHYIDNIEAGENLVFFSEDEICKKLNISRPTVNKAVKNLIKKGVLKRSRNKKAEINKKRNVGLVFLSELESFSDMLSKQHMKFRTSLLNREIIFPNNKIKQSLNLADNERVIHLKRIRYIDEEPMIIVDSYLPQAKYDILMNISKEEFQQDLYKIIDKYLNIKVNKSDREVYAQLLNIEDANLLNLEIWDPCLRLISVTYDKNNEPIECFDSRLNGSKCVLKNSIAKS